MKAVLFCVLALWAGLAQADAAALSAVNTARAGAGLAPVAYAPALEQVAQAHARDMARTGFFSHEGSDGSSVGERARRAGYGFCLIAENIAKGQGDLRSVMADWMASAGHRRNILQDRATEVGLARADGNIWVMVLGRPGC